MNFSELSADWHAHFDHLQSNNGRIRSDTSFHLSTTTTGGPGGPKFSITKEQLEYLSSMSFTWPQIAQILRVSRMTIYRRRKEFNLLMDPSASITDRELKSTVHTLRSEYPEIGETMVWGHLRSMGIQVTRERARNALSQSDPLNSALRWRGTLTKRKQSVI